MGNAPRSESTSAAEATNSPPSRLRRLPAFALRQYMGILQLLVLLVCFVILGEAWLGERLAVHARQALMALPAYDYEGVGRSLLGRERLDEALDVIDAGLEDYSLDHNAHERLRVLRARVEEEKNSWMRTLRNFGDGALTGKADTAEGLAAALITDLLVIGDVRDLAIEGKHWIMDEEVDEIIVILSAVGLATTAAPYGDWFPSVLKAAARTGKLSKAFVKTFGRICKAVLETRDFSKVRAFGDALWNMAKNSSTFQAMHLLRHVDDVGDATRLAAFMGRHPKQGAFALRILDDDVVALVAKGGSGGRAALTAAEEGILVAVAKKGRAGQELWRQYARWLRPHPSIGLLKGVWKENLQQFLVKTRDRFGFDAALVCLGVLAGSMLLKLYSLRKNGGSNFPRHETNRETSHVPTVFARLFHKLRVFGNLSFSVG